MRKLSSSVGTNGSNAVHDVAIVQLMLAIIKRPGGGGSYFPHSYLLPFGEKTAQAISAFQTDRQLIDSKRVPVEGVTVGVVAPDSKTWAQLDSAFSANNRFKTARTCPGQSVAYLPQQTLGDAQAELNKQQLHQKFRKEVSALITACHAQSELVWFVVAGTGGFRAFEGQKDLKSEASYGETIHNYGYAVDLAIRNLSWFDKDQQLHTTGLAGVDKTIQHQYFDARDRISNEMELYPTTMAGDRWHLQAFPDEGLDSVTSFMSLLQRVGPRKMKWQARYRTPTDYLCDLGLKGELYYVGTAKDIWTEDTTHRISKGDLVAALKAKIKTDPKFSVDEFFGKAGSKPAASFKDSDIGAAEIAALQRILKREFEEAAAKWQDWKPVNYPTKERREKNKRKP